MGWRKTGDFGDITGPKTQHVVPQIACKPPMPPSRMVGAAYHAAKVAGRMFRAKGAHADLLIATCCAQADVPEVERRTARFCGAARSL